MNIFIFFLMKNFWVKGSAEGTGQCHSKAKDNFSHGRYLLTGKMPTPNWSSGRVRHGLWGATDQSLGILWSRSSWNLYLGHTMDMKVTGNNQHGFTESKLYLRNLIAFYDEIISYANDGKTGYDLSCL